MLNLNKSISWMVTVFMLWSGVALATHENHGSYATHGHVPVPLADYAIIPCEPPRSLEGYQVPSSMEHFQEYYSIGGYTARFDGVIGPNRDPKRRLENIIGFFNQVGVSVTGPVTPVHNPRYYFNLSLDYLDLSAERTMRVLDMRYCGLVFYEDDVEECIANHVMEHPPFAGRNDLRCRDEGNNLIWQ